MKFSCRVPSSLEPNRLARAMERARAAERSIIDLTLSNPTKAGFVYPRDLLAFLNDTRALVYDPTPAGNPEARAAVQSEYRRHGISVGADRIVLTSSTSEAYSLLFKVFCDPQDEVLVPRPSYPLFEHLAQLDAVIPVPYGIEDHSGWSIDLSSIERGVSSRTRAVLVVTPNNPTGSFIKPSELEWISTLCAKRGIALIADEVFADYELTPRAAHEAAKVLHARGILTFSLGGLSKSIGLPQAKLAWIAVGGPDDIAADALKRLEFASDTYLTVSTPVQIAAPSLLAYGAAVREQIQLRAVRNLDALLEQERECPACRVLKPEGGWYAVVQVPTFSPEEDLVVDLLENEGVLVHPGYFFDFERESFLIVSLLVPESTFVEGTGRMLRHFRRSAPSTQ